MKASVIGGLTVLLALSAQRAGAERLFVASYLNDNVRAYDATTGASLGVFIGGAASGLFNPGEIAFGPDGDLYVSNGNDVVRRFDGETGAFVRAFSDPTLDAPRGLAFGSDGMLYVASAATNRILRFDPSTGSFLGQFAAAGGGPCGIAFGPDGNLYAAIVSPANRIERFDPSGVSLGVFASGHLNNPQALVFGPNGNLFVNSQYDWNIIEFDGDTGTFIRVFIDQAYPYNPSTGIAFGPDGNFYSGSLTSGGPNDGVHRYNGQTGQFIDYFVPGSGSYWSTGLAFEPVPVVDPVPVPEPSSIALAGFSGFAAIAFLWHRRRV